MLLTDIVDPHQIKIPLTSQTKNDAIAELVDLLASIGKVSDREKALAAIMERENTRTTGIGNGLAIPHGKTAAVGELVMAIGRCAAPVDFQSVDSRPVSLVVMMLSPPDQTGPHIQALARISRLMSIDAFRNKVIAAATPDEMYKVIQKQEEAEG